MSDAYQLLERRGFELVELLDQVESAYRRSLLKWALKRVEVNMAALRLHLMLMHDVRGRRASGGNSA